MARPIRAEVRAAKSNLSVDSGLLCKSRRLIQPQFVALTQDGKHLQNESYGT